MEVGGSVVGPAGPVVSVGLPPIARTPSQWSSGHGEVFARRPTRAAAGRVSFAACASQIAVLVAPTSWPTCSSSAWAATRDLSSTTCDSSRVSSTNVAAVSAASMDHTDTSTRLSATSRSCAVAEATWWRGVVIAVMGPSQPAPTGARIRVTPSGGGRCCRKGCGREVACLVGVSRQALRAFLNHRGRHVGATRVALSTGPVENLWSLCRQVWTTGHVAVEQPGSLGGTEGMFAKALARGFREGIELLPRLPATGGGTARRRGSTRLRTGLRGSDRGGWVTRPLGPETTSVSTGSVTGTGHLKGPCDSYSQGPFVHFRVGWFRGSLRSHLNHRMPDPGQLWGSGHFLWTTRVASVDELVNSGGTRGMFRKGLARPLPEGIELLSRPPETGGGTARRRGS